MLWQKKNALHASARPVVAPEFRVGTALGTKGRGRTICGSNARARARDFRGGARAASHFDQLARRAGKRAGAASLEAAQPVSTAHEHQVSMTSAGRF